MLMKLTAMRLHATLRAFIALIAGASIASLAIACSSVPAGAPPAPDRPGSSGIPAGTATEPAGFSTVVMERGLALLPGRDGTPSLRFETRLVDGVEAGPTRDALRRALYDGYSREAYAERAFELLAGEYGAMASMAEESRERDSPGYGASFSWEYLEEVIARWESAGAVGLERTIYAFRGGAHGMTERRLYTVDLLSGRLLGSADILVDPESATLRMEVEAALREVLGLEPGASLRDGGLFADSLDGLPHEIGFCERGLAFHWDQYEIGPYSLGPIEAILPFERARPYLTPRAAEIASAIGR